MNINVEYDKIVPHGEIDKSSQSKANSSITQDSGVYALDISDIVMDDTAYKGQGKTKAEVMQEAQNTDVATQRNYMAVMSNSMSSEDFQKLKEEGFPVGATEVEKIVTVVDQIKAKMAEAGIVIEGFTDSLSTKQLEKITGSSSRARAIKAKLKEKDLPDSRENVREVNAAVEEALKLTEISDNTKKYVVENNKLPTIDNLYKAQFSSSNQEGKQGKGYYKDSVQGHYAKKAEVIQWDQLEGQIDKVRTEASISDKEGATREAKWLIKNGIPLTKSSLKSAYELSQLKLPQESKEIITAAVNAMVSGKSPKEANLINQKDMVREAVAIRNSISEITDQGIESAILQKLPLNLNNLIRVSEKAEEEGSSKVNSQNEVTPIGMNQNRANQITATPITMNQKIANQITATPITANQNVNSPNNDSSNTRVENEISSNTTRAVSKNMDLVNRSIIASGISSDIQPSAFIGEDYENSQKLLSMTTVKRQLEEIRLTMTVEANLKLLKKGFSVNTQELEKVVEALKNIELETKKVLFGADGKTTLREKEALFLETKEKVSQIPYMPAAVLGKISTLHQPTLNDIYSEGRALEQTYKEASKTYEALMTAPRKDLGDSQKKAFRNINDILVDMDLDITERNQKAIRILGYNQMELTDANVMAVKEADLALEQTIEKLTPARTLNLIRKHINPLEITVKELEEQLDLMKESEETPADQYAKFLQRLEQHNDITPEEKDAYIGIHRLLRQVEKEDSAAIGSLINNGNELSFANLLSAVKSKKRQGMDYKIDEKFVGVEESKGKYSKISDQINNYYQRLATDLKDTISNSLADNNKEHKQDAEENRQKVQLVQKIGDHSIQSLLNMTMPVTVDHLLAADSFSSDRNFIFNKMKKIANEEDLIDSFQGLTDNISEKFLDKEEIILSYEGFQDMMNKMIDSAIDKGNTSIEDMKQMSGLYKQISFATQKAKEENYELPVTIHGEMIAINLKIVHGKTDKGKVVATMKTEKYGEVSAEFRAEEGKVRGYIVGNRVEGIEELKGIREYFEEQLISEGQQLDELQFITSNNFQTHSFMQSEKNEISTSSTKELYQVAKAFIKAIEHPIMNENGNRNSNIRQR